MRTFKLRYAFKLTDILLALVAACAVAAFGHWAFLAALLVLVARDNLTFTLDSATTEREAEEVIR